MGLYVFLLFRGTGPDAGHSLVALSNEHADDWETLRCYINEDILDKINRRGLVAPSYSIC